MKPVDVDEHDDDDLYDDDQLIGEGKENDMYPLHEKNEKEVAHQLEQQHLLNPKDHEKIIEEKEKEVLAADAVRQRSADRVKQKKTKTSEPIHQQHMLKTTATRDDAAAHTQSPHVDGKKGLLMCNGSPRESEVIYWKDISSDRNFESPITPHHGVHHDRYLSFEYDQGGWNNIRMGMEVFIVCAHAMGRTLVIPPQQNLYLLGSKHKGKNDKQAHSHMEFEDFFNLTALQGHAGLHIMTMQQFLLREGTSGGLHGVLPPDNRTDIIGPKLWDYLHKVADETPQWTGKYLAMPRHAHGEFDLSATDHDHDDEATKARRTAFAGGRTAVYYNEKLQSAHHIHFSSGPHYRVLQHHYGE